MTKYLHIVSFDIPYPANYGGAIDVFYRIKALHDAGVNVILHCYYKGELHHESVLENLCYKVYYYKRRTTIWQNFSLYPYAVESRPARELLQHLLDDKFPILFEGLVCSRLIDHKALNDRQRFFRECNVEHDYYRSLAKASSSLIRKIYFCADAVKLYFFERKLEKATAIFALSHKDEAHFLECYPNVPTVYLPCFHSHENISALAGKGDYVLYHGNLSLAENDRAAQYVVSHISAQLPEIPFVIAGFRATKKLRSLIQKHSNVTLVDTPSEEQMNDLIMNAQVHLLITFQATGLKLKLLNVLYSGRYVVVNPLMVAGTELSNLCAIGSDDGQLVELCRLYYSKFFTEEDIAERRQLLNSTFSNKHLVATLIQNFAPFIIEK